jgi:hypothetical protein
MLGKFIEVVVGVVKVDSSGADDPDSEMILADSLRNPVDEKLDDELDSNGMNVSPASSPSPAPPPNIALVVAALRLSILYPPSFFCFLEPPSPPPSDAPPAPADILDPLPLALEPSPPSTPLTPPYLAPPIPNRPPTTLNESKPESAKTLSRNLRIKSNNVADEGHTLPAIRSNIEDVLRLRRLCNDGCWFL